MPLKNLVALEQEGYFKKHRKKGSGRLVGWTEDVFGFFRLLSCLERWKVHQKRANRYAKKPCGGDCRIIQV
jgi:hypothetical protein